MIWTLVGDSTVNLVSIHFLDQSLLTGATYHITPPVYCDSAYPEYLIFEPLAPQCLILNNEQ
jgi:hypothetical protein